MGFHIAHSRAFDAAKIAAEAKSGQTPDHAMRRLSVKLGAQIHAPQSSDATWQDRIPATILGSPAYWGLGRRLAQQLTAEDVVYCTGEENGIPLATMLGRGAKPGQRPKTAVFFHTGHRPRVKAALKLFKAIDTIDLFVSNCSTQIDFLRSYMNLPEERLLFLPEQTDTDFFSPGPISPQKTRPLIVSVGLEKRDYRILAAVTADLPVDVKISGFSADVKALKESFPEVMPANMECKFFSWPELQQLYRDADIVVVSLMESRDTAGVTSLIEGMACGRPVIATRSSGLLDYLDQADTVMTIEPHDQEGLRKAIHHLLSDPVAAAHQGQQAYALAQARYRCDDFVVNLAEQMQRLGGRQVPQSVMTTAS
jgi:glycosyltransferase involved in cell wall biosynthesis